MGAFLGISKTLAEDQQSSASATAIFAGGCFWCEEEVFDSLPGVISTLSGFTGGHTSNPTYKEVSAGGTGHLESVQVTYDPQKISYGQLLDAFWHNVDPFDAEGQFCDKGDSYKAAIFYTNSEQKKVAEESKQNLEGSLKKKIVTEIRAASIFYPAEEYHQKYAQKNPIRYTFYRSRCGRDERLQAVWGNTK